MKKFALDSKVKINLKSEDARSLGISRALLHEQGTITGTYPLGHYVRTAAGKTVAIADKYEALTQV